MTLDSISDLISDSKLNPNGASLGFSRGSDDKEFACDAGDLV